MPKTIDRKTSAAIEADLIGDPKLSDLGLAKRYGCCAPTVKRIRQRLNLMRARRAKVTAAPVEAAPPAAADVEPVPAVVEVPSPPTSAVEVPAAGVSPVEQAQGTTAAQQAEDVGSQAEPTPDHVVEADHVREAIAATLMAAPTLSDAAVAKTHGASVDTVREVRAAAGLPTFREAQAAPPPTPAGKTTPQDSRLLTPRLAALVPRTSTTSGAYVELFAGLQPVVCHLNGWQAPQKIVHDDCLALWAFYRVCSDPDLFGEFQRRLQGLALHQQFFDDALARAQEPLSPQARDGAVIARAVDFFVATNQSDGRRRRVFLTPRRGKRGKCASTRDWAAAVEGLPKLHASLSACIAVTGAPGDVLDDHADGEDVTVFCRLPLWFTGERRQELLDDLEASDARVIVASAEPARDAEDTFRGWSRLTIRHRSGLATVWLSFQPSHEALTLASPDSTRHGRRA